MAGSTTRVCDAASPLSASAAILCLHGAAAERQRLPREQTSVQNDGDDPSLAGPVLTDADAVAAVGLAGAVDAQAEPEAADPRGLSPATQAFIAAAVRAAEALGQTAEEALAPAPIPAGQGQPPRRNDLVVLAEKADEWAERARCTLRLMWAACPDHRDAVVHLQADELDGCLMAVAQDLGQAMKATAVLCTEAPQAWRDVAEQAHGELLAARAIAATTATIAGSCRRGFEVRICGGELQNALSALIDRIEGASTLLQQMQQALLTEREVPTCL